MKKLSIIHPYYKGGEAIETQREFWSGYTDRQKSEIKLIVVDDGSPTPLHDILKPVDGLETEVYRVTRDIKWNQHGARNLGALVSDTPLLLMLDWDCGFTSDGLKQVMDNSLRYGQFMRFAATRTAKPRYNQFLCWRSDYIQFGGYDEYFTGTYGGDGSLIQNFEKNLTEIVMPAVMKGTAGRTPDMDRPADRILYEEAMRKKKEEGIKREYQILKFPWRRVM